MQHACLHLGTPYACMYMYSMFHMVWTMHVHVLCTRGVLACVPLKLVACLVHVKVHVGVHVHVCTCTCTCTCMCMYSCMRASVRIVITSACSLE